MPNREDAQIKYGKECANDIYEKINNEIKETKKNNIYRS